MATNKRMTETIRWCRTHSSPAVRPVDDPDDYWLCAQSNLTGDRQACDITEAEVTWHSP